MLKKKLLYMIPGFGESIKDPGYSQISTFAKQKGYSVVPINIKWERTTIDNWLELFKNEVAKYGDKKATVLGFSFGAMVALLISPEFNFNKLLLCSLSPYFSDDINNIPEIAKKSLGLRRIDNFKKYDYPRNINTSTIFFIGDQDWKLAIDKIRKLHKIYKEKSALEILNGVDHNINHPEYIKILDSYLKK